VKSWQQSHGSEENEMKKWMTRKPKGFVVNNQTGELACPHRNISTCDECAATYLNIVEVYGTHFWLISHAELGAHINMVTRDDLAKREELHAEVEAVIGTSVRNCFYEGAF
jgi:hypothetical protein